MNDFKVGDIVRIVRTLESIQTFEQLGVKKNEVGIVVKIESNPVFKYPIVVQFNVKKLECSPVELEHVNKLAVELI